MVLNNKKFRKEVMLYESKAIYFVLLIYKKIKRGLENEKIFSNFSSNVDIFFCR